jgi:hypothetical protein
MGKRDAAVRQKMQALLSQLDTKPTPRHEKSAVRSQPRRERAKKSKKTRQTRRQGASYGMSATAPVASATATMTVQPTVRGNYRSTRIRNRELISTVTGSVNYAVLSTYPCNPGQAQTFPWLATQAASWEQYKFHSLKFIYYARCATSVTGTIMLIPDYDAADAAPQTEVIACSYRGTMAMVPWTECFEMRLDPGMMNLGTSHKFIRTSGLAANLDIKTYDSANVYLAATDGSAVNWGKLWVEYDVELFEPQLQPQGNSLSASFENGVGATMSNLWGGYLLEHGSVALPNAPGTNNSIAFLATGIYYVTLEITGTSLIPAGASTTGSTVTILENNSYGGFLTNAAGTVGRWTCQIQCTAANQVLTVPTFSATLVSAFVQVSPCSLADL